MAVLCPFPAGMCVRCVCARVFPAFPRREAEGDGAPTTEGSRHQPSRLRQKIAVVPALLAGLADPPPAPRSARCVPARHRPGPRAEEEEETSVWARQGYEGTVPGRGKEMERWGSGVIGLSLRARWPQPGCGACGDQSAAAALLPLLPVVPLHGLLDPFSHFSPSSFLPFSQLFCSLLSFCPPLLPPSSLLCPPFQVPQCILPSLQLPPARFSFLQLAPSLSTYTLSPSCQLGGFLQQ